MPLGSPRGTSNEASPKQRSLISLHLEPYLSSFYSLPCHFEAQQWSHFSSHEPGNHPVFFLLHCCIQSPHPVHCSVQTSPESHAHFLSWWWLPSEAFFLSIPLPLQQPLTNLLPPVQMPCRLLLTLVKYILAHKIEIWDRAQSFPKFSVHRYMRNLVIPP